jgi:hypothetical protein
MPLEMMKVRFLRSIDRFAAGDTTTVDAKIADCWIRRRLCVPEPGEAAVEVAVVDPPDVRTADATPRRKRR